MLDNLKTLANLPGMLAKAREMQEKMKSMQDELARRQVSADAGGGMVSAVVNGRLELVKIRIDKSKIDPNDTEMLEDLIVAAVSAAQSKAADMMKDEMNRMAADAKETLKAIGYFENNQARMLYGTFRAKGYFIGSRGSGSRMQDGNWAASQTIGYALVRTGG